MIDLTLKEKILKSLFESNKTTGELLASLRYGKTKYNAIDKDLKKLAAEGLIFADKRKIKGSRGQPPTYYGVVFELPTLQKILDDHSSLRSAMQKNDAVLSLLVKKQYWLINYNQWKPQINTNSNKHLCDLCLDNTHLSPPLCGDGNERRQQCLNEASTIPEEKRDEYWGKKPEVIQNELIDKFKKRLRISPSFFKACLTNTVEDLRRQLFIVGLFGSGTHAERRPLGLRTGSTSIDDEPDAIIWADFNKFFEICVIQDVMNKEATEEAIEEVLRIREHERKRYEYLLDLDKRPQPDEEAKLKTDDWGIAINEPIKTEGDGCPA